MTRSPLVVSTTTKLSDDTERRLTASAGYDSLVQFHCPSAWWTNPSSDKHAEDLLHVDAAELLVGRERQLEGGALHVIDAGCAGCRG